MVLSYATLVSYATPSSGVSRDLRLPLWALCPTLARRCESMLTLLASSPQRRTPLHIRGGPHSLSASAMTTRAHDAISHTLQPWPRHTEVSQTALGRPAPCFGETRPVFWGDPPRVL